jgi:signal transduction histidine kinase
MRGWSAAVLLTAVVSAVVTLATALLPQLHFTYWQPWLHAALETAASLIALLAGFLFFGRLRRARWLNELLLACGLALLALLNLFLLIVPAVAPLAPAELVAWAALLCSLLAAVLFALAAFVPPRRLRPSLVLGGGVAGVATAVLVTAVASRLIERLPQEGAALRPLQLPGRSDLHDRPAVLALQLLMSLLYGLAAVGFLRRSRRLGDEFLGWLAIAAILAAASHVNYFLYPSLYSQWVHTGDAFRLCFYAILLAGSMRELRSYWHALSVTAVLEERQRIARDLHDGLAQELAYLARNLDSLDGDTSGDTLRRLLRAVERALVRIACEAVTNAARHSGSSRVRLTVEHHGSRVRLWVSDEGCGFDTAAPGGFGLVSMRERAHSVGGELCISSAPGRGSDVEVTL